MIRLSVKIVEMPVDAVRKRYDRIARKYNTK
jgi:hypothetical protein